MAHDWQKNENGSVDMWAMNPYASSHHGPKCTICGLQFCIDCNPEFLTTNCSQFMAKTK